MNWINLAQYAEQRKALWYLVIKLWVPWNLRNFLTGWVILASQTQCSMEAGSVMI